LRIITRLALALACVGALALPTTAQAVSSNSVCEFGEICLWRDAGLRGGVIFDKYAEGPCWSQRLHFVGSLASSYYVKASSRGRFSSTTVIQYAGPWSSGNFGIGLNNNVEWVSNCW